MTLVKPIYLDHAATTPLHPEVIQYMSSLMPDVFGNPSSVHSFGRKARFLLDEARAAAARSIGAKENEIIFTSGGTEADNLALIGAAFANKHKGKHLITTAIEHHAVLHTCEYLEKIGYEVTYISVNREGFISLRELEQQIREDTIVVSIMYGNNEVGTLQPIKEIGALLAEKQIVFHTDAVQAFGTIPIDVSELNVDLLSASSHKINGPKGVGFLFVKEGTRLEPLFFGGEQERKRRAGTENVLGICGFHKAIEIMADEQQSRYAHYEALKAKLLAVLTQENIAFHVNGSREQTLPHVINISFPGADVESLLTNLDLAGIAVSSGSACTAGSIDPSHVLVAMYGKESERIRSSIRFSFGMGNTLAEIELAAAKTAEIVKRLVK